MLQRKKGSAMLPYLPLLAVAAMLILASCCCCAGGDEYSDWTGSVERYFDNCTWQNTVFGYICHPNNR
jgi:hypothetical protein